MKKVPKAKEQAPPRKKPKPPRKTHAWRLCSPGEHWVRTHSLKVPPSRKDPNGSMTTRHGHCAANPTGKDQLYRDEIQEIASENFSKLKEGPCPDDLGFRGRHKGNEYDGLIAGWTKYWNDVFKPSTPLDPDIVKALVASESGFDPGTLAKKKNKNSARGLLQITNDTRKILGDEKGELKDHSFDPLFAINHTFAMLRANIARLVRRSWVTTKKASRLEQFLQIYMAFHNLELTAQSS